MQLQMDVGLLASRGVNTTFLVCSELLRGKSNVYSIIITSAKIASILFHTNHTVRTTDLLYLVHAKRCLFSTISILLRDHLTNSPMRCGSGSTMASSLGHRPSSPPSSRGKTRSRPSPASDIAHRTRPAPNRLELHYHMGSRPWRGRTGIEYQMQPRDKRSMLVEIEPVLPLPATLAPSPQASQLVDDPSRRNRHADRFGTASFLHA